MLLEKEWLTFSENNISFKIPKEILDYFRKNYGEYFSVFCVEDLLKSLNNIKLKNGCLGYFSHFKVEYVDEYYLTSSERFRKISNKVDRVTELDNNDFDKGFPILIDILKEYMGVKLCYGT
ncbi:hypothetical protein IAE51_10300 [Lactococcus sp. S64]|uniref:hypothetical protein n=1 Tax=Lactococcus sp. S64 TaxID=2767459 RepID=UPI001907685E|nr:hypothetical protein [Lactococcus sp. S64]MBK0084287.1 hypothetical protein [Lactococcus sp. S64]